MILHDKNTETYKEEAVHKLHLSIVVTYLFTIFMNRSNVFQKPLYLNNLDSVRRKSININ